MPIYEYQCKTCGHELEKLQRMADDALKDCPACGKPELKRLISAAAFRLKGAGWYETDFKKDNRRNLADSSDSGSPGAESSGDKKDSSDTGSESSKSGKSKTDSSSTKPASKPKTQSAGTSPTA